MSDPINPQHYKHLPAEAIDIIEAAIEGAPSNKVACLHWQTLKYLLRCWEKNGVEDLRKGKVYLDRLIDSFEANEPKQPERTPKVGDWVKIKKPDDTHLFGPVWVGEMDKYDGQIIEVKEIIGGGIVQDRWGFLFDWLEPAEQPKARAISDTIPEGCRKLKDSSEEPRQLGDLRWSISQKRYVEIGEEEIGYANRDNWAACRRAWRSNDSVSLAMQMAANSFGGKDGVFNGASFSNAMRQLAGVTCNLDGYVVATILEGRSDVQVLKGGSHYRYLFYEPIDSSLEPAEQPVVKDCLTPEPPDGWRWLEVGEVIRKGDKYRDLKSQTWIGCVGAVGDSLQDFHKPTIRRNRFEVGEKVAVKDNTEIWEVDSIVNGVYQLKNNQCFFASFPEHLAPYIEETK